MATITLPTHYYQQFDADYTLEVPGEGYGGWRTADLPLALEHTALVVMHAWDCGTVDEYPGWYRAVEYIPRAAAICREVFPPLLAAVRQSPMPVFHVVGGGSYYRELPGYVRAKALAGEPSPGPEQVERDPVRQQLGHFRGAHVSVGAHNRDDVARGFARVDFPPEARPVGEEGVAENGAQLFALCRAAGVSHLIYAGFAINMCLLLSGGGMIDMSRHGLLCSAIRQAVTAVENRETARGELGKENGLWRVALQYGFVYDLDTLLTALAAGVASGVEESPDD